MKHSLEHGAVQLTVDLRTEWTPLHIRPPGNSLPYVILGFITDCSRQSFGPFFSSCLVCLFLCLCLSVLLSVCLSVCLSACPPRSGSIRNRGLFVIIICLFPLLFVFTSKCPCYLRVHRFVFVVSSICFRAILVFVPAWCSFSYCPRVRTRFVSVFVLSTCSYLLRVRFRAIHVLVSAWCSFSYCPRVRTRFVSVFVLSTCSYRLGVRFRGIRHGLFRSYA